MAFRTSFQDLRYNNNNVKELDYPYPSMPLSPLLQVLPERGVSPQELEAQEPAFMRSSHSWGGFSYSSSFKNQPEEKTDDYALACCRHSTSG
eukprot:scaffold4979_cov73-Cylindrotheca_fusiformis.AAC.13